MTPTAVFRARPLEGYELVMPIEDSGMDVLLAIDGSPRAADWTPIRMRLIREDHDPPADLSREADLPWFMGAVLVLRKPALDALAPLLRPRGELLPLECDDAELWLFNATTMLDALDESRSDLSRFDDGRIMLLRKPAFKESAVRGVAAFKVVQDPRGPLYLGEAVVRQALEAELRGVEFEAVWTSRPSSNGSHRNV